MDAGGPGTAARDVAGTPRRPLRRLWRFTLLILLLAVALLGMDFLIFVRQVPEIELPPARNADGIVVLTGGAFRINDALDLLAAGRGQRLLISGVNPQTRPREIQSQVPEHQRWFNCCVDIGHEATNTIGNAVETKQWVDARKFRSLIVVTSNFHMPRAMVELEHQLPNVALVPYAVVSDRVRVEAWWENPATARLLFLEYLKYVLARTRPWLPSSFDRTA
jgi:uncharacterized SAM-binding protein YcdF (DUF218 family)